jgi:hypothetical protein
LTTFFNKIVIITNIERFPAYLIIGFNKIGVIGMRDGG